MSHKNLTDAELQQQIKTREAQGRLGMTDPVLDGLNREQTDRLSNKDLLDLLQSRIRQGKPAGKLAAAARARGISF